MKLLVRPRTGPPAAMATGALWKPLLSAGGGTTVPREGVRVGAPAAAPGGGAVIPPPMPGGGAVTPARAGTAAGAPRAGMPRALAGMGRKGMVDHLSFG